MLRRTLLASGLGLAGAGAARAAPAASPETAFDVGGYLLLRAYQSFVEEHLAGVLRAMRALASTSDARSGEWARLKPALARMGEDSPTYATIWFVRPDGAYYTVASDQPTGLSLADREYFPELIAGQDIQGDVVTSKSTGRHAIIIATPVFVAGKVIGAIGGSVDGLLTSELVEHSTGLPAQFNFYALTQTGVAAIHKDPNLVGVRLGSLSPSFEKAVQTMTSQAGGVVTYAADGISRTAIFNRSYTTRWTFALSHLSLPGRS